MRYFFHFHEIIFARFSKIHFLATRSCRWIWLRTICVASSSRATTEDAASSRRNVVIKSFRPCSGTCKPGFATESFGMFFAFFSFFSSFFLLFLFHFLYQIVKRFCRFSLIITIICCCFCFLFKTKMVYPFHTMFLFVKIQLYCYFLGIDLTHEPARRRCTWPQAKDTPKYSNYFSRLAAASGLAIGYVYNFAFPSYF